MTFSTVSLIHRILQTPLQRTKMTFMHPELRSPPTAMNGQTTMAPSAHHASVASIWHFLEHSDIRFRCYRVAEKQLIKYCISFRTLNKPANIRFLQSFNFHRMRLGLERQLIGQTHKVTGRVRRAALRQTG
jgi:hypothetical protein